MAILIDSRTLVSDKNKWSTMWEAFWDAEYLFMRDLGKRLVIDVAAEPQTAKLDRYYLSPDWVSEQDGDFTMLKSFDERYFESPPQCVGFDALQCDWVDGWWCNPPFDNKVDFIDKAVEEMFKGHDGMMLLPYEPLAGWWRDHVHGYASMVYEPNGRYSFYEVDGRTKKHGVNFGSVLLLFSKRKITTPRDQIIRGAGQALLAHGWPTLPKKRKRRSK